MISKSKLKDLCAFRLQKNCDEQSVYVAEGTKMAHEAAASDATLRICCATSKWLAENEAVAARFEQIFEVSEADLERLSLQKTPCGVWMLIDRETQHPVDPKAPLVLALDRLQDPGNLGTIMRTADWFGVRNIVCSSDSVSNYNPKAVQASMGAVLRTSVTYVADLAAWLGTSGRAVCGADLDGTPVFGAQLPRPAALVIGNESRGLSPEVRGALTHRLTIPNVGGTAESLNASVAAAIICAEFFR